MSSTKKSIIVKQNELDLKDYNPDFLILEAERYYFGKDKRKC